MGRGSSKGLLQGSESLNQGKEGWGGWGEAQVGAAGQDHRHAAAPSLSLPRSCPGTWVAGQAFGQFCPHQLWGCRQFRGPLSLSSLPPRWQYPDKHPIWGCSSLAAHFPPGGLRPASCTPSQDPLPHLHTGTCTPHHLAKQRRDSHTHTHSVGHFEAPPLPPFPPHIAGVGAVRRSPRPEAEELTLSDPPKTPPGNPGTQAHP